MMNGKHGRLTATPADIEELLERGAVDPPLARAALGHLEVFPTARSWRVFLRRHLLLLGVVLLVVGTVFFFAANWAELGYGAKQALVLLPLLGAAGLAGQLGTDRLGGRAAVMFAGLLIGPALAVYGQHFQTGADPWQLFFGWSLLLFPFALLARFVGLWVFWLILSTVTFGLFQVQVGGSLQPSHALFWGVSGLVYAAALVLYELFSARGWSWLSGRWAPRVLAAAAALLVSVPAAHAVAGRLGAAGGGELLVLAMALVLAVSLSWLWGRRWPDLVIVAVGHVLVLFVAAVWIVVLLFEVTGFIGGFFLSGGFILGEVALLTARLRWLQRSGRFS